MSSPACSACARGLASNAERGVVAGFAPGRYSLEVKIEGAPTVRARLLIAADGARSQLRTFAEIGTVGWDYGQSAIVATIAHERDHHGRAEQHFLPAGPFAILPLAAAGAPASSGAKRAPTRKR